MVKDTPLTPVSGVLEEKRKKNLSVVFPNL